MNWPDYYLSIWALLTLWFYWTHRKDGWFPLAFGLVAFSVWPLFSAAGIVMWAMDGIRKLRAQPPAT